MDIHARKEPQSNTLKWVLLCSVAASALALTGYSAWSHRHVSDLVLGSCKYGGSVISLVYGVYATITDFREEKDGKKIISKQGYLGIALLVSSTVLTGVADWVRDRQDTAEQAHVSGTLDDENKTLAQQVRSSQKIADNLQTALQTLQGTSVAIAGNAATTRRVLMEQERMLNPLTGFSLMGFKVDYPLDSPEMKEYGERLRRELGGIHLPTNEVTENKALGVLIGWKPSWGGGLQGDKIVIRPNTTLQPTPQEAASGILKDRDWEVSFYKPPLDPSTHGKKPAPMPGLQESFEVGGPFELIYDPLHGVISQESWGPIKPLGANHYHDNLKFASVLDLPSSSLFVSSTHSVSVALDGTSRLSMFVLQFPNNQLLKIGIEGCKRKIDSEGYPDYLCALGRNDLPRSW